ncbi:MAG: rubrerythrin family protein [Desulfobulbaceae bacterium]|nr:rubrerythrin family protein [Desulfobulbaceae bacterium]
MNIITKLLSQAIQGESFAEKRYDAFARHAIGEGFPGIARLFTGLARAEAVHIANHKRALEKNNGKGDAKISIAEPVVAATVVENIATAIQGEHEEITSMYPSFIKQVKKRHGSDFVAKIALLSMSWAMEAEKGHLELLRLARQSIEAGKDMNSENFYLCRVCGNVIYQETAPQVICPICGHDPHFYSKVTK